jgi:hypothetical protein
LTLISTLFERINRNGREIKINIEEIKYEDGNESALKKRPVSDCCEHGDEPLGYVKESKLSCTG